MLDVLSEIIRWSKSLQFWEQAAMDKILSGEPFADETYQKLYQYLLEDAGLKINSDEPRPELKFLDGSKTPEQPPHNKSRLAKISNLQNINALAKDQSIPFSPQLTAIYGANGSGKSGYARVFGCAGFTRGDRRVFPNISDESGAGIRQSVDIRVCSEGGEEDVCYLVGEPNSVFSFCHVFDSTSVDVHLSMTNEFSFSPAGLETLTRLAEETDVVRRMLRHEIAEKRKPHEFGKFFVGEESVVSQLIQNLGEKTDIKDVNRIANVTQEDEAKAVEDAKRLSFLKSLNVEEKVKVYGKNIEDLNGLKQKLVIVGEHLKEEFFDAVSASIRSCAELGKLAKQMGVDQFKCDFFTQVGSDEWYAFIKSAKELAEAESVPPEREPYPKNGERCLLCRQVLSPEALELVRRIWRFLEDDVQKRLGEAQDALRKIEEGIDLIQIDFFCEESVYYRLVQDNNPGLLKVIKDFLETCRTRKAKGLEFIKDIQSETLAPLPSNGISGLDGIIAAIEKKREDLLKNDPAKETEKLEKALMLHRHRLILREIKKDVFVYIISQAWASAASKVVGNTAHITKKHDSLFEKVVTEGYVEHFNGVIAELDPKINVKIDTIPRKASTYKQIVLEKCVSAVHDATPDKILSEGEKRAVSLADFLTEVCMDPGCSCMVLDDPVTFFDLEWREKIAPVFAREAADRQVIIFTHDLAFLYHLIEAAEKEGVEILCHWIQRGWSDGLPGHVSVDNSPAIDRSYKKPTKAQKMFERAKKDDDFSERERLLKDGLGALRTCYEAFIIYDLFNEVVERFGERIRFGNLSDIVWDESIACEAVEKFEDLSLLMEGHLHSARFAYKELTPDILNAEIQHFIGLKKQLKDLKKEKKAV